MKVDDFEAVHGQKVSDNKFKGFRMKRILIEYDSPLLFVAEETNGENWLFKWCDDVEGTERSQRWIALQVSNARLKGLEENSISLREVVTLPEKELYIFDGANPFSPHRMKLVWPENLPSDYVPTDDIGLDGSRIGFEVSVSNKLAIMLHVFSEHFSTSMAPISIVSPLQQNFQQYISWTAHSLEGTAESMAVIPIDDWSNLNLALVSSGSYKAQFLGSAQTSEQSDKLSQACRLFSMIAKGDFRKEAICSQMGEDGFRYAMALARLISTLRLSLSVKWSSQANEGGYLAIDKRRADNFLNDIQYKQTITEVPAIVTVTISDDEAAALRRPVEGEGGMESLLRKLGEKVQKDNSIKLTPTEVERIRRYYNQYGEGGWQVRLAGLVKALERLKISFD